MKIAIIGTGSVGGALGRGWARCEHEVVYGSRHPEAEETRELVGDTGFGARAATPEVAVADADVVVLAVPWEVARKTVAGLGDLGDRVLVDCTNPLTEDLTGLTTDDGGPSGGEQVAEWAEGGRVVKAFCTTGSNNMAHPRYGDQRVALPVAGDDVQAKDLVMGLARDLGLEPLDAGDLVRSRDLESWAMLWIQLAFHRKMGREIGFVLVRREDPTAPIGDASPIEDAGDAEGS
jgi:8-hydroxy-5-deazaflavin:NADPH oxidoreductase